MNSVLSENFLILYLRWNCLSIMLYVRGVIFWVLKWSIFWCFSLINEIAFFSCNLNPLPLWSVVWIILSCDENSVEEGPGSQYHVLSILLATMKHAGIREVRVKTSGIPSSISSCRKDVGRTFKETFSFCVFLAL